MVEEARQEALKQESSKSNVSSIEDPFDTTRFTSMTEGATSQVDWTTRFSSVTKDATNQEDWREGFSLVIEGETSQEDWSAVLVADLVWEIEILLCDGGWNTSLTKREC